MRGGAVPDRRDGGAGSPAGEAGRRGGEGGAAWDLAHFRGNHDNALALLGQIGDDAVDLVLCTNVDAAGILFLQC